MKKLLLLITALFLLVSVEGQILRYSNYTALPSEGGSNDLLDSLTVYYDMGESSGNLSDEIESRTATANGTPSYSQTGKVGDCISFSGDDYFAMTEDADLRIYEQDISFSCWFYINALPSAGDRKSVV